MKRLSTLLFIIFLASACSNNNPVENVENPDFLKINNDSDLRLQTVEEIKFDIVNNSEETFYFNHLEYEIDKYEEESWINLPDLSTTPNPNDIGPTPLLPGESYTISAPLPRGGSHSFEASDYRLRYSGWFNSNETESNQETIEFVVEFTLD